MTMLTLERRAQPSRLMAWCSPLLAVLLTALGGSLLFMAVGKDQIASLRVFLFEPIKDLHGWAEVGIKVAPLLMIAVVLSICFRANVFNIGAEGQLVVCSITAGALVLYLDDDSNGGFWLISLALLAGALGGMAWAAITAFLRDRFNANEILVSLMLVYVAVQVLNYLVYGPWKDPMGYNFPQTKTFESVTQIPRLMQGSRVNIGLLLALAGVVAIWLFLFRTYAGY